MAHSEVAVKYIGSGVRSVDGVGLFQQGTVVHMPADKACRLMQDDDDFVIVGSARPVSRLELRVGQTDPPTDAPELAPPPIQEEMEPWLRDEPDEG